MNSRPVLATLLAENPCERIQVDIKKCSDGSAAIQLLQQTKAVGVGWYTQQTIDLEPQQALELKACLGMAAVKQLCRARNSRFVHPADGPHQRQASVLSSSSSAHDSSRSGEPLCDEEQPSILPLAGLFEARAESA